jgi:hypothetical protein
LGGTHQRRDGRHDSVTSRSGGAHVVAWAPHQHDRTHARSVSGSSLLGSSHRHEPGVVEIGVSGGSHRSGTVGDHHPNERPERVVAASHQRAGEQQLEIIGMGNHPEIGGP